MTTNTATAAIRPSDLAEADERAVRHLPLVGHLVRETMGRVPAYVDRDALHSAGQIALVSASRSFDPERGVPFQRYATTRIRGALVDELRSVDWASRSVRRRSREIAEARARLTTTEGQSPDDAAVAKALGMDVDDVARTDSDVARATVLPLDARPDYSLADMLPATAPGPEAALLHAERLEYLVDAIAVLPERLAAVVQGYFLEERPMTELAVELGVTESRISQLRAEALVLLRDALNTALDPHLVESPARPAGVVARRRAAYASAVAARHHARVTARTRTAMPLEASA